jgi:N-acetylglucosaminyl-diphospho-decaprenol L-rhamnosyltransferase
MLSLLVVNYRSASLAAEAIRTARAATTQPLQVVVVDNSCDEREAEALRPHADVLLVSATNRGYAGAINDGRRACDGETIIVTNPDVTFAAGAIDALVNADASVAGPALFWDAAHEWILPPSELHTGGEKLAQVLASRSRAFRAEWDQSRIRRRIAFWSLTQTTPMRALSGAVMAIRARAFDDAGGFDERFPLYFEENDFLRRVHGRVLYVPAAKCRHIYNQSASRDASHAAWSFADSERRYLAKWNGPFVASVLKRIERPLPDIDAGPLVASLALDHDDVLIEASPLASFATAAGHFPRSRRVALPADVLESFTGEAIYLRVIERSSARVLATYALPTNSATQQLSNDNDRDTPPAPQPSTISP